MNKIFEGNGNHYLSPFDPINWLIVQWFRMLSSQIYVFLKLLLSSLAYQIKENLWTLNYKRYQESMSVTTKPQGASFPIISRTCGLSIKRYWYQVSMSVTTKPQGVSLPRISRTCGLSFRRYWCKVSMSVRASSQNQQYNH